MSIKFGIRVCVVSILAGPVLWLMTDNAAWLLLSAPVILFLS